MASTSPVVSQSLEKELHRRYSNREIKTKRVLQIWIAKKTNPMNPGRAVTWEEKGETWYTWVTQMFHFLQALLCFGKVLKIPSFFFFLLFFFLFNNNRTCVSKKSLPHRCVKRVMPQLLSLSCVTLFQSRSLALGSGVFARYLEKSVGRRVFCHSFLILFAFQPDFTFYLYCARSHIYWLEPAGSSQRSSRARANFSHLGALVPSPLREDPPQLPPASSQASQSYWHGMPWHGMLWEQRAGPGCSTCSNYLFVTSRGDWTANKCI